MRASQVASVFRLLASWRVAPPASLGAAPPTLDVEKNTGSMPEKSPSSRILWRRTLPTIPRHPMNPTRNMISLNAQFSPAGHNFCDRWKRRPSLILRRYAATKRGCHGPRRISNGCGVKNDSRYAHLKPGIFLAEFHQARFRPKPLGTVQLRNEGAMSAVPRRYQLDVWILTDRSDAKAGKWDEGIVLGSDDERRLPNAGDYPHGARSRVVIVCARES